MKNYEENFMCRSGGVVGGRYDVCGAVFCPRGNGNGNRDKKDGKRNIDYFINNCDVNFSNKLLKSVDIDLKN